jgi:hypothetical protein
MPQATWDSSTRTYASGGQSIDPRDVRSWVREAVDASKESVRQAAEAYRRGDINLPQLVITIREEMVSAQTAASVIARGGREQMDASMWGSLGSRVREQNEFLRAFERGIANGDIPLDGRIDSRAVQYVDSAVTAYENEVVGREKDAGVVKVVWVCADDEASCDECSATAGEYEIESVPAVGSLVCLNNCRCYLEMVAEAA